MLSNLDTRSEASAHDRLIRKLETLTSLSADEEKAVRNLPLTPKIMDAHQDVVRELDRPDHCCLLIEGFIERYKVLGNGKRQILSLHVPGDIPDLLSLHLRVMDHSLGTITPCVVGFIPHKAMREVLQRYPTLADAFWRDTLVDAAVFREWITNVGSRPGAQRLAHLFCEFFYRLRSVGLAEEDGCEMPLTQATIGEAAGLSSVHVNRMLQELRGAGLIASAGRRLRIPNWPALQRFAGFDPTYLHLGEA